MYKYTYRCIYVPISGAESLDMAKARGIAPYEQIDEEARYRDGSVKNTRLFPDDLASPRAVNMLTLSESRFRRPHKEDCPK